MKISLKFVPSGPINNIPALVQIMAWHWPGYKPLSKAMMVSLLTPWFPRGPYFREKCLFWNMGVPALEKSLLLNIFDRSPGKVLIFNRCVKTWMINIVLRKLRFFQVLWQWRRTFRESQRPVNQSPVARGMTPSGSRQNTTCFIHKILLRSNWEPIGRHMMSRGSCTQFDWSTVSPVHMAHALQNIEHIRGNTATYLRLNSANEWSVCT